MEREAILPKKPRRTLPNGEVWNQAAWAQARQRAMASKDPVCALCHTAIDMSAPAFDPNACEVDHIIPTSRGGPLYDIENLQLTHSRCNRQKGARMKSDYAGLEVGNPVPISNKW